MSNAFTVKCNWLKLQINYKVYLKHLFPAFQADIILCEFQVRKSTNSDLKLSWVINHRDHFFTFTCRHINCNNAL